jgi:hypothetical protein
MSAQREAALRQLLSSADRLGVQMPPDVDRIIRHALSVEVVTVSEATVVQDVMAHLGDPAEFAKQVATGCDLLARSSVSAQLLRAVQPRAVQMAWQLMMAHRDAVGAAFGQALQPQIDALIEHAPEVPESTTERDAATLNPEAFGHWRAIGEAVAVLESAFNALAPAYRNPVDDLNVLTLETARRLIIVEPPDLDTIDAAVDFRAALSGERQIGGHLSPHITDNEGAWFAKMVRHNGRFVWATPTEWEDRLTRLRTALVRPVIERNAALPV